MTAFETRSRLATALVALCAWIVAMGLIAPGATAADEDTTNYLYKDKFDTGNYNGNDGSHDFWGPWFEYGDWGGAGKGAVAVESGSACPNGRCARITGDDEDVTGKGLARWADLSDAAIARIKFKYHQDVDASAGGVRVVVNDGNGWHTVFDIEFDEGADATYTETITVTEFASSGFAIGFFAYGQLDGDVYIDDISVFGSWDIPVTTTSLAPTTTAAPTSTNPPASSTTTVPPSTTTTTTAVPPTTLLPPVTTNPPPATTIAPVTSQPPPTTTEPPAVVPPIETDLRYIQKAELANHLILANSIMELPTTTDEIPEPSPVTQIMASVTTTAVTVRSHLFAAMALGLLIAIAAVWGLGRREPALTPVREPSSL
jgi:hypothetical protein